MTRLPSEPPDVPDDDEDEEAFEHILTCFVCGQSFDMRDEQQLEHHEQEFHAPLPRN